MEQHPSDAIHVNVGGTAALLDAAAEAGVDRFVLVSTDKAVKPSSVMGASKRIAEMLVADTARRTGRAYVSVRFGNVLGSNGSVVPIFRDQLERGLPLTITHPDMTRFFMTIPEAAWLILDAAALGQQATCSSWTWASRSRSWTWRVTSSGSPVAIPTPSRSRSSACDRARSSTKSCSTPRSTSSRPRTPRSCGPRRTCRRRVRDDVARLMSLASGQTEELLRRALVEYARGPHHEPEERGVGTPVMAPSSQSKPSAKTLASIGATAPPVAVR